MAWLARRYIPPVGFCPLVGTVPPLRIPSPLHPSHDASRFKCLQVHSVVYCRSDGSQGRKRDANDEDGA